MSKPVLVHLLDDFALGGVTRNLHSFSSPEIDRLVQSQVKAIKPKARLAPRLNAQIIVLHFPPSWPRLALLASLRLRNPGAKIIQQEHSYTSGWEANNVASKTRFRAMLKLALKFTDSLVCVSRAQARWFINARLIPPSKCLVINPYSANAGLRDLPVPDFASALLPNSDNRPLRIGAYGRFQKVKGFDRLINAYRAGALPNCEVLIGGYGEEEESLKALAGDADGIRFCGKIEDVAGFLSQCDLVAVPSRWESFGLVASEAREAARPILVSGVDGLPEQVGNAGLVVDFDNHASLKRVIESLTPLRLEKMARAGRAATKDCAGKRMRLWAQFISSLLDS